MPQIEDIGLYLKGVWLLIRGDRRGFELLDLSVAGVWRSFTAFLWCLPAMAVGWSAWRLFYLSQMPEGTETGAAFIFKLFLVDVLIWIIPLILIAALARPLGFAAILVPIVTTTNWLSVPVVYAMAVPLALRLLLPESAGFAYMLSLILLIANFTAIFRLIKTVAGDQLLLTSALSALLTLLPLMLSDALPDLFRLTPVYSVVP